MRKPNLIALALLASLVLPAAALAVPSEEEPARGRIGSWLSLAFDELLALVLPETVGPALDPDGLSAPAPEAGVEEGDVGPALDPDG